MRKSLGLLVVATLVAGATGCSVYARGYSPRYGYYGSGGYYAQPATVTVQQQPAVVYQQQPAVVYQQPAYQQPVYQQPTVVYQQQQPVYYQQQQPVVLQAAPQTYYYQPTGYYRRPAVWGGARIYIQ